MVDTVHRVEMGGKELDLVVLKRSCDERDRWIGRSVCPEIFRRKWEFKLLPEKKPHTNCDVAGTCVFPFSKTEGNGFGNLYFVS